MSVPKRLPALCLTLSLILLLVRPLSADDAKTKAIPGIGPADDIVKLHTGFKFTEGPANVTFGGKDLKTLYVAARTSLYTIPMDIRGHLFALPEK
jgi:hypothetical protein